MARDQHTAEKFERTADDLAKEIQILNATTALLRETEMPFALIHRSAPKNAYRPAFLDWIEKSSPDIKMQNRAYLTGVQSQAKRHKQNRESKTRRREEAVAGEGSQDEGDVI